jgi:hypothetical protein
MFPIILWLHLVLIGGTEGSNHRCPVSFDGRIPRNATKELFNSTSSPFNPNYVMGQSTFHLQKTADKQVLIPVVDLSWDQIVEFPHVPPSRVLEESIAFSNDKDLISIV